jgi:hypothetical protein
MEIWPKNYDAPRVLILDDDVSTEKTVRLSIEDEDDNVSETVLIVEMRQYRLLTI